MVENYENLRSDCSVGIGNRNIILADLVPSAIRAGPHISIKPIQLDRVRVTSLNRPSLQTGAIESKRR
jgi:hypothetical protein